MQFPKTLIAALVLGIVLVGAALLTGQLNNLYGKAVGTRITGTIVLVDKSATTTTAIHPVVALPGDTCRVQMTGCATVVDTGNTPTLNPINASTSPPLASTRKIDYFRVSNNPHQLTSCKTSVYDSVDNIANGGVYTIVSEGCSYYDVDPNGFQVNWVLSGCTAAPAQFTYLAVAYSCT